MKVLLVAKASLTDVEKFAEETQGKELLIWSFSLKRQWKQI